jgi:hypothetical protein
MSSFSDSREVKAVVLENVALMRWLSSHLGGGCPINGDSQKTCGFSAPKPCVGKRLSISDEPPVRPPSMGHFLIDLRNLPV